MASSINVATSLRGQPALRRLLLSSLAGTCSISSGAELSSSSCAGLNDDQGDEELPHLLPAVVVPYRVLKDTLEEEGQLAGEARADSARRA